MQDPTRVQSNPTSIVIEEVRMVEGSFGGDRHRKGVSKSKGPLNGCDDKVCLTAQLLVQSDLASEALVAVFQVWPSQYAEIGRI